MITIYEVRIYGEKTRFFSGDEKSLKQLYSEFPRASFRLFTFNSLEDVETRTDMGDDLYKFVTGVDRVPVKEHTIAEYMAEVNDRAMKTMDETGVVSGAHWNAMYVVAKEWGIEPV